jgi:hypothetical protein
MVPEKLTPSKLPHPKASAKQAPPYPLLQMYKNKRRGLEGT